MIKCIIGIGVIALILIAILTTPNKKKKNDNENDLKEDTPIIIEEIPSTEIKIEEITTEENNDLKTENNEIKIITDVDKIEKEPEKKVKEVTEEHCSNCGAPISKNVDYCEVCNSKFI